MMSIIDYLAQVFLLAVGSFFLLGVLVFVYDKLQKKRAILRNYPVIGHFRYIFERLGEYFRQYFFAMDREELPFNRAERNWVERATLDTDNTVAFGSTRDLRPTGTVLFVNCPFPTLDRDATPVSPVTLGPYVPNPYTAKSIFNISGMSFGAISKPAVQALSAGAKKAAIWMNTGEGALSPYHLEGGADIVFQIGTAKYGCRNPDGSLNDDALRAIAEHEQVRMFEIKLSQGAKPGKGGILPGAKVTPEIAKVRLIDEGQDSISPNRHPEINSIGDLLDFIDRVRKVTQKPTGIKSVIGAYGWLDNLCKEIHRRGIESAPDFITVDSADGGTGAAPMSLIDTMGLPIRESLPLVVDALVRHRLRDRVKVICSGKLITPSEVAWALCAGADFCVSARGFMFALGCIQALSCNKNTCPTGITTHNKSLQKGLVPKEKAISVQNFAIGMNKEVGIIAHSCGVNEPRQLRRYHCRVVQSNGISIPLDELFPDAQPIPEEHLKEVA